MNRIWLERIAGLYRWSDWWTMRRMQRRVEAAIHEDDA